MPDKFKGVRFLPALVGVAVACIVLAVALMLYGSLSGSPNGAAPGKAEASAELLALSQAMPLQGNAAALAGDAKALDAAGRSPMHGLRALARTFLAPKPGPRITAQPKLARGRPSTVAGARREAQSKTGGRSAMRARSVCAGVAPGSRIVTAMWPARSADPLPRDPTCAATRALRSDAPCACDRTSTALASGVGESPCCRRAASPTALDYHGPGRQRPRAAPMHGLALPRVTTANAEVTAAPREPRASSAALRWRAAPDCRGRGAEALPAREACRDAYRQLAPIFAVSLRSRCRWPPGPARRAWPTGFPSRCSRSCRWSAAGGSRARCIAIAAERQARGAVAAQGRRTQPGGDPAPARRTLEPRRRRPHRAGHRHRGHDRRDRRLDQLRGRGAARPGHDHQRLGDPARRRGPPDHGARRAPRQASSAQSKQIASATESIAEMAAFTEEVSGNAERAADVARHSVDVAHKGGDAVRRTIDGMNAIRETIQETSKRIKRLGESSQEIGNIVELINDIAEQTNILALNASIQASMAGEAGRGFAVVADEVQRLAERAANATKQIEVLVRTIQADTNEAVVSMERSTDGRRRRRAAGRERRRALEEIEQVSNQIASLVQNISASSRQQASARRTSPQHAGAEARSARRPPRSTSAPRRHRQARRAVHRAAQVGVRLPPARAASSAARAARGPASQCRASSLRTPAAGHRHLSVRIAGERGGLRPAGA
jgi:hypothetical protein